MKKNIISSVRTLAEDRYLLSVLSVFILIGASSIIYLALAIHASERQVAVHYTSFGTTNFYRDKWYYLLSFIVYVLIMLIIHILLTHRILQEKGRHLAVAFAWLGVVVSIISITFFIHIIKIASII